MVGENIKLTLEKKFDESDNHGLIVEVIDRGSDLWKIRTIDAYSGEVTEQQFTTSELMLKLTRLEPVYANDFGEKFRLGEEFYL